LSNGETGGEAKCVAIQIASMNIYTSTMASHMHMSIFMMPNISTVISAAIEA
jgi:hypothetical protein